MPWELAISVGFIQRKGDHIRRLGFSHIRSCGEVFILFFFDYPLAKAQR